MGFQSVGTPYPQHRSVTYSHLRGQRPCAPVCCSRGHGLGGEAHDLGGIGSRWASTPGAILFDGREAALRVALPPASHLNTPDAERLRDRLVGFPHRCVQYHLRPAHQPHACRTGLRELHELPVFFLGQHDRGCTAHRRPPVLYSITQTEEDHISSRNYEAYTRWLHNRMA